MNPRLEWLEAGQARSARWRSEAALPPHTQLVVADDSLKADAAYRRAADGCAILWRGDWQNARQLLLALSRRADRQPRVGSEKKPTTLAEAFALHRRNQGRRAGLLGMLLVPLDADYSVP
ncbi:MAG TPA: methyltransferase, partial [Azonexus sp.]|nr:methyltransferase [Azonexus sp.]